MGSEGISIIYWVCRHRLPICLFSIHLSLFYWQFVLVQMLKITYLVKENIFSVYSFRGMFLQYSWNNTNFKHYTCCNITMHRYLLINSHCYVGKSQLKLYSWLYNVYVCKIHSLRCQSLLWHNCRFFFRCFRFSLYNWPSGEIPCSLHSFFQNSNPI